MRPTGDLHVCARRRWSSSRSAAVHPVRAGEYTFIKSIGGARIDARISEVSGSPGRSLRSRCGASPASPLIPELIETPFCRRAR